MSGELGGICEDGGGGGCTDVTGEVRTGGISCVGWVTGEGEWRDGPTDGVGESGVISLARQMMQSHFKVCVSSVGLATPTLVCPLARRQGADEVDTVEVADDTQS